jgi:hypothetical protein
MASAWTVVGCTVLRRRAGGDLPRHGPDVALEAANAGFARSPDDAPDRIVERHEPGVSACSSSWRGTSYRVAI